MAVRIPQQEPLLSGVLSPIRALLGVQAVLEQAKSEQPVEALTLVLEAAELVLLSPLVLLIREERAFAKLLQRERASFQMQLGVLQERFASTLRMTITSFFSGSLYLFSQKNNPSGLWGFSRNARWKTNPVCKDDIEKNAASFWSIGDTIKCSHDPAVLQACR
jgi:hypothetical protein